MACKDSKGRLRVAAGVGVTNDTLERMRALVDAGAVSYTHLTTPTLPLTRYGQILTVTTG